MINETQFIEAAKLIGCEVATIKAVFAVEARGKGFLDDGRLKILFEPHVFWRELVRAGINPNNHVNGNEDILYRKWQRGKYGPETAQWGRLERAIQINKEAALKSASYGSFQTMGFNFRACGFTSVEAMVEAYKIDDYEHLKGFIAYVKTSGLSDELVRKDWPGFGKGYNGAEYKGSPYTTDDDYDLKLASAYKKALL